MAYDEARSKVILVRGNSMTDTIFDDALALVAAGTTGTSCSKARATKQASAPPTQAPRGTMSAPAVTPQVRAPGTLYSLTETANASNFNGTAIAAGNYVWFTSVVKVTGVPSGTKARIFFPNSHIDFSVGGTGYHLPVPSGILTIDPAVTQAITSFNTAAQHWETTVPSAWTGNSLMAALTHQVPSGGLPA